MRTPSVAFAGTVLLVATATAAIARPASAGEAETAASIDAGGGSSRSPATTPSASAASVSHKPTTKVPLKRVTGIGGVFFKARDAPALRDWYKHHLGIDVQVWGGAAFHWVDRDGKPADGATAWLIAPQDSQQFAPSNAPFMVDYRVDDLRALLGALRAEGCNVLDKISDSEYGKFGWVIDPEGNKVELWEPPAKP